MRLRFVSAQPATDYYAWQVEVYLTNFVSLGYENIDVVAGHDSVVPLTWLKLKQKFKTARFFFYENTMSNNNYPPAIQAHILEKHWCEHPYLKDEAIFFHDCDFLFTKYFDFTPYLQDSVWYFSDTISYIGAKYIKSKGEEVLDKMCEIIGISRNIVEANECGSGGAQKLLKNVDSTYWANVCRDSVNLYSGLGELVNQKKDSDTYPIQIWCASMWAELWNAWKLGFEVVVPKEFDFCWATCPVERWDHLSFFHNAGVVNANQGMFFKGDYVNKLPYDSELAVNEARCSYKYYSFLKNIESVL